ncbi:MAG: alanine--tRNA ligase-related protein, partial [Patescibacteria group bacterium]
MNSEEIRSKFLTFFKERGHAIVPSSSLIPDDPSVLLTTAGMQQFKKYYTGEADPMKDFGSLNTCSIQKSFRTSDIDEVGDESHNTFFEMLGNFSFGGYFKKEAIEYGYDFITKEMGLAISYVTIFKGSDAVPKDTESERIWKSLGVADVREEGMEDVFWGPTGASGPCGPTTEIYCKNADGKDVEIWNIVFNEFLCNGSREQLLKGNATLTPLEKKGIDTGMGLERLVMIAQERKNIFETDLFAAFHRIMRNNMSYQEEMRIIADHARAITFLLADGVYPSNKVRGYILRRLIRRVIVQWQQLGFSRDVLFTLVTRVIEQYGTFYGELKDNQENIKGEFMVEIERFDKTLKSGAKEFFDKFPDMKVQEIVSGTPSVLHRIKKISGEDAFYFHQSYGLTLDVIKDLAKRGGHIVEIDEREFEKAIEKHREISRAGQEKKFGGHGLLLDTGE